MAAPQEQATYFPGLAPAYSSILPSLQHAAATAAAHGAQHAASAAAHAPRRPHSAQPGSGTEPTLADVMATLQAFRQESLDRADRAEQAHQALQQQINTTSAAVEQSGAVQQSAEHATLVGARVGTLEASVEAALLEANQQVQQLRQEKAALERQLSNCSNTLSLAMYRTNKQVTRHQFAASNGDRKLVLRHTAQEPLSAATIFGRTRGALSQDVRIVSVRPLTAQGQGLWVVEASSREAQQQLLSAWNSQSPGAAWQWVPADEKARRRFTSAFLFQVHRQLQSAPSHDPHATRLRALVWGVYYGEPCVAVRPEAGQPALWHSYPIGTHVPGGALFEFEPHGVNLQNVREQAERALSSRTLRGGPSTFWEFRPEQGRSPTGSPRRPPSPQAVSAARQRAQQERMAQHHQQRQQQQQQQQQHCCASGPRDHASGPRPPAHAAVGTHCGAPIWRGCRPVSWAQRGPRPPARRPSTPRWRGWLVQHRRLSACEARAAAAAAHADARPYCRWALRWRACRRTGQRHHTARTHRSSPLRVPPSGRQASGAHRAGDGRGSSGPRRSRGGRRPRRSRAVPWGGARHSYGRCAPADARAGLGNPHVGAAWSTPAASHWPTAQHHGARAASHRG